MCLSARLSPVSTGNGLGPEREQDRKIAQMALVPRLLPLALAAALVCAGLRSAARGRETTLRPAV
eukprot:COSAG01_NODE_1451_length_10269_cov_16.336578_10_plen_65_part_00